MSSTRLSVCVCEVWVCVCVWDRERERILCYIQSQIFSLFSCTSLPDLISSNRNWTQATAVKALSLNHWTTKELLRIIASLQSLPDDSSSAPLSWGPRPTAILPSTLNSGPTAYVFPTLSSSLGTWHILTYKFKIILTIRLTNVILQVLNYFPFCKWKIVLRNITLIRVAFIWLDKPIILLVFLFGSLVACKHHHCYTG